MTKSATVEAPTMEAPTAVENESVFAPVTSLIGLDYDKLVSKLRSRQDFKAFDNMRILNVSLDRNLKPVVDEDGVIVVDDKISTKQVSITVATKLPQYLQSDVADGIDGIDEDGYGLSTSTTLFLNTFQIAGILKQIGRIQFANAVIKNPALLATILEGARISAFGKEYHKGDVEQSPFSSNINEYIITHHTIRYYAYDIVLGKGANALDSAIAALAAKQIMGL